MPPDLCLKCCKCGGRLIFLRTEGDQDIFQCASCCYEIRLKTMYTKRFKRHSSNSRNRKIPEICPSCGTPSNKQATDKNSVSCTVCGGKLVWDGNKWLPVGEGIEV